MFAKGIQVDENAHGNADPSAPVRLRDSSRDADSVRISLSSWPFPGLRGPRKWKRLNYLGPEESLVHAGTIEPAG